MELIRSIVSPTTAASWLARSVGTSPCEERTPFYIAQNSAIGSGISAADELLHPEVNRAVLADSATKTRYLGFSVPSQRIHALCYLWHHPTLKTITGGLYVWKGIKRHMPAAELCDARSFMSDRALAGGLASAPPSGAHAHLG